MVAFHNRTKELQVLRDIREYSKKQSQMVVIYGRRRVGKTELVKKFLASIEGKCAYAFIETKNETLIFDDIGRAITETLGFTPKIDSWDTFFEIIFKNQMVVVLDEFPNIVKANTDAISKIQRLWDKYGASSGCMLVIVGSYVGMIKKMFFDEKQPLFGRAKYKMCIFPFDFVTTCGFLKGFGIKDAEKAIEIYSAIGGVPHYLMYMEFTKKEDFIKKLFFEFPFPLGEEGKNILVAEFGSEHAGYFSILEAVAAGKNTPKLISDRTGLKPDTAKKYIYELTEVYGILQKEYPIGERKNRKSVRYRITDTFFNFWFRHVYSGKKSLSEEEMSAYMGTAFEAIVRELILYQFPQFQECGRWWLKEEEIDAVCIDRASNTILFCECTWQNKKIGRQEVEELIRKSKMVSWHSKNRNKRFLMVSKNGFTSDCLEKMRQNDIQHWTIDDIGKIAGC